MRDPKWKEFEIAVANFISALDPSAKVTHDAMIPDKDTGTLRQRDVWIETKVSNHFSLQILVSCKRYKSKLNQQHMDAFIGELQSSGAQKGVIYSYSGFTKPALEKAQARGISCCRLYQDEVSDLPEMLSFHAFLLTPAVHFWATWLETIEGQPETLGELYALDMPLANGSTIKLLDLIIDKYLAKQKVIRAIAQETGDLPEKWTDAITLQHPMRNKDILIIEFGGDWDIYEATLEGYLLNGSYSFTENEFRGRQSFPNVADVGPEPGEVWKRIEKLPSEPIKKLIVGVIYGNDTDAKDKLLQAQTQRIQNVSNLEQLKMPNKANSADAKSRAAD